MLTHDMSWAVSLRPEHYDVAIIGGGPGGSTTASLLMKYQPGLKVLVLERERFPREHIGESQLPYIGAILQEMGCWDAVEAANFPIKIGGTFRWGSNPELWDFEFLPLRDFHDEPRPAQFVGQRQRTAFQVDRAIYDDILLKHAGNLGAEVRQETAVTEIGRDGDRITGLTLANGDTITATYYVDASGHAGILRRAMGVDTNCPTHLRNIAIWDYWDNAEWAVHIGVGGTRIQVMSVGFGWIWFIPLGPTRTSVGLVCPASYFKACGKSPEELYVHALASEERIARLTANGTREHKIRTTKDWSFLSERAFGENWFLVGEACGFADPILSAGMTLTHSGGRELAYTLLALLQGEHDPAWLKQHYNDNQLQRVWQHIRFADYWYAANGQFTDLKEHCQEIAREAGLNLQPHEAWAWLARGGFALDLLGQAGIGGYDLALLKQLIHTFSQQEVRWAASAHNVFVLNLDGATEIRLPAYSDGRIVPVVAYARGERKLAVHNLYQLWLELLKRASTIEQLLPMLVNYLQSRLPADQVNVASSYCFQVLEVLVSEGWVKASLDPTRPRLNLQSPAQGDLIHPHWTQEQIDQRTTVSPPGSKTF